MAQTSQVRPTNAHATNLPVLQYYHLKQEELSRLKQEELSR